MHIRNGRLEDLERLAEIEAVSYPAAEAASKASILSRLKRFPKHFWILEEQGKICAFINGLVTDERDLTDEMYGHPELHRETGRWQMIFSVVTAPEYRGRGFSRCVMEKVIEDAKAQGRAGVVLTCKAAMVPFYARFGYVNEGLSRSTHGDAVWYQMRLTL